MSDDKAKTGNPDRQRINIHEDYQRRDWANKFGVSRDQLESAVIAVGTSAKDVEQYLSRHK